MHTLVISRSTSLHCGITVAPFSDIITHCQAAMRFSSIIFYLAATGYVTSLDVRGLNTDISPISSVTGIHMGSHTSLYQAPRYSHTANPVTVPEYSTSSYLTPPSMTASVVTVSFNGRIYTNTAYFPVTSMTVMSTSTTKTYVSNTYTPSVVQPKVRTEGLQRYVTDEWELYQRVVKNDIVIEAIETLETTVESPAYGRAIFTLTTLLLLVAWLTNSCWEHISFKLPKISCKITMQKPDNSYDNQVFQIDEA